MKRTYGYRNFSFVILLLFITISTGISQSKFGTSAAQFLGIPIGAKGLAMGSAFVASSEDVSSIYWNPGGFVQAGKSQVSFVMTDWLVDTKYRSAGVMLNLDGQNAFGLTLTQLDYGEEEVNTVAAPEGTGDRWSAEDLVAGLSYSRRFTDRFSLGGTVKYIGQSIWNEQANGFAFDLGLLFVTEFNNMRLGMSMSNFGGDMQMEGRDLTREIDIDPGNSGSNKDLAANLKTDAWPLPLMFRVGVAMDVMKNDMVNVTLAADALRPSDSDEQVNIGGEIGWREMLFVRGGYKSLFLQDAEGGLSLGGGLKYQMQGLGAVEVHYSYNDFGVFDPINTWTVAITF